MVLLALISCAVFAVSSATVHGCITPFCSYSFLNVCGITSHSGLNIPGDGGRQCICLGFFLLLKGLEVCLQAKIAWQEITKRLVSKSDFLPCEFFCLAQRQDSSWPAQTEVELITTLESVLWLGRAAGWKKKRFQEQSGYFQFSPHLSSYEHWWDVVTAWTCHWVFNEGNN